MKTVHPSGFRLTGLSHARATITKLLATQAELVAAMRALVLVHRQLDTIGVMPADKAIAYGRAEAALARAEGRQP